MIAYRTVEARVVIEATYADEFLEKSVRAKPFEKANVEDMIEEMEENERRLRISFGPLCEKLGPELLASDEMKMTLIFEADPKMVNRILHFWSTPSIQKEQERMEEWLGELKSNALGLETGKKKIKKAQSALWKVGQSTSIEALTQEECVEVLHYLNYKERRSGALLDYLVNQIDMSADAGSMGIRSMGLLSGGFHALYKSAGGNFKDFVDASLFSYSYGGSTPIRVKREGSQDSKEEGALKKGGDAWSEPVLQEMRKAIRFGLLDEGAKCHIAHCTLSEGSAKRPRVVHKSKEFEPSGILWSLKNILYSSEHNRPDFIKQVWVECKGARVSARDLLEHWEEEFGKSFVKAKGVRTKRAWQLQEYEEQKHGALVEILWEEESRRSQLHTMHVPASWCAKVYKECGMGWRELGYGMHLLDALHVNGKMEPDAGSFSLYAARPPGVPYEKVEVSPRACMSMRPAMALRAGQIKPQYEGVVKSLESVDDRIECLGNIEQLERWVQQQTGVQEVLSVCHEKDDSFRINDIWQFETAKVLFEKYELKYELQEKVGIVPEEKKRAPKFL